MNSIKHLHNQICGSFYCLIFCLSLGLTMTAATAHQTHDSNITETDVLAAQQGWCQALLNIAALHEESGQTAAAELAGAVIDTAYGYAIGPVLFKPTLAHGERTVRTTREGALSYFVGGDDHFPEDSGFALKGWNDCQVENAAIHINGDVGLSMGFVHFFNNDGQTTVDKTWGFKKTDDGAVRIVLHHSSLPFSP